MTIVNTTGVSGYIVVQDDTPVLPNFYQAGRFNNGAILSFSRFNDGDIVTSSVWVYVSNRDNTFVTVIESEVIP